MGGEKNCKKGCCVYDSPSCKEVSADELNYESNHEIEVSPPHCSETIYSNAIKTASDLLCITTEQEHKEMCDNISQALSSMETIKLETRITVLNNQICYNSFIKTILLSMFLPMSLTNVADKIYRTNCYRM